MNKAFKLSRNGSYGKTKDIHSALYAPEVTCSITVNGQLLITKLMEMIFLELPTVKFIQTNTDGITVYIEREHLLKVREICEQWEKDWDLKLDYVQYKTMIMRDVNNFLAIPEEFDASTFDVENKNNITKDVKMKGFFEVEKEWHKNHSMKIVQKALANYFIKGIPIEKTIKSSSNIFDFFKMCKAKSNFKIEYWVMEKQIIDDNSFTYVNKVVPLGKITRYLVTNKGGQLMKIMPPTKTEEDTLTAKQKKITPNQSNIFDVVVDDSLFIKDRESNVEAGYICSIHNKLKSKEIKDFDINYDYYINECSKVIKAIENNERFEIADDDQLSFDYD